MIHVRSLYILLALFGVLAISVSPVTAYTITNFSLEKAPVHSGDSTNISYEIIFPEDNRHPGETFPSGSDLVMSTDLENVTWTYHIILGGYDNPRPPVRENTLNLSGFELSYPSRIDETLRVHLNGTAPVVPGASDKNLIKMQEIDSHGESVNVFGIHWTIFPVP